MIVAKEREEYLLGNTILGKTEVIREQYQPRAYKTVRSLHTINNRIEFKKSLDDS